MNNPIMGVLREDREIIPYRKSLRAIGGSVTATILLQQLMFRDDGRGEKFYKFTEPCKHPKYRPGDSWTEELGFSVNEFNTALGKIGFKLGKKAKEQYGDCYEEEKAKAIVWYYTDNERVTWYTVNNELLSNLINRVYQINTETGVINTTENTIQKKTTQEGVNPAPAGELGLVTGDRPSPGATPVSRVIAKYNEVAKQTGFPACNKVTPEITGKLRARLKDHPAPSDWKPIWDTLAKMAEGLKTPDGKASLSWVKLQFIIRSEDNFDKIATNAYAWKIEELRGKHPSNQYFAGEDSAMRRAIAKRTVKVAADGTITMPEENV